MHRGLDRVAGADGLDEVVAGVEEERRRRRARPSRPGAASTASPIEEVTQKRSPNVAAAHSTITSAGASLELGAPVGHQLAQAPRASGRSVSTPRLLRAAVVVAAVMTWPPRAEDGRIRPSIFRLKARWQPRHSQAPCGEVTSPVSGRRPRAGAGPPPRRRGSGTGRRARSCRSRLCRARSPRSRLLVGALDPGRRRSRRPRGRPGSWCTIGGDVVVQAGAGDLVGAQACGRSWPAGRWRRRGAPGSPRPARPRASRAGP